MTSHNCQLAQHCDQLRRPARGARVRGARVRSAIQTRTDAYSAVEASSVEKLIRTTNARPGRAGLPRSGSRWRIRGGLGRYAQPFESHTQGPSREKLGIPWLYGEQGRKWLKVRQNASKRAPPLRPAAPVLMRLRPCRKFESKDPYIAGRCGGGDNCARRAKMGIFLAFDAIQVKGT